MTIENLSTCFIVISLIIIAIYILFSKSNFFSFKEIFIDYFKIFNKDFLQIIFSIVNPLFLSVGLGLRYTISLTIIDNINVILAIVMAMFFATQSIIVSFNKNKNNIYNKVLVETNNLISMEITLGTSLLILTFIYMFIGNSANKVFLSIYSGLIYYISIFIFMNIFVLSKRMKKLCKFNYDNN